MNLLKGISIERLDTFCLVVQAGSIAAAAVNDPTRQSQFSKQIKDLEEALGTKLVHRVGKLIKPTNAGLELAALAGTFFSGLEDLATSQEKMRFVVAAGDSVIRWLFIPLLNRIQSQEAKQWVLRSMRTLTALQALRTSQADLAIIREDAIDNDFTVRHVAEFRYVWVFARTLLPGRTGSGIYEAKQLPIGTLSGDGVLARQIRELSEKNNLPFTLEMELESFSLMLEAVKGGRVGALLPQIAAADLPSEHFAVIDDENLHVSPRPLALAVLQKSYDLRPALRNAFDDLSKLFLRVSDQGE